MVRCQNCGVEVSDDFNNCPNCGSKLSKEDAEVVTDVLTCSDCGTELDENNAFCPKCGKKVESKEDESLKCKNCGAELPENTLFCTTCGAKVDIPKNISKKHCPNCGVEIGDDDTFCEECGTNVFTGDKNASGAVSSKSFVEKINLATIIKPSIVALVISIILSLIGLAIGLSWLSFIIAIILSAGFFAAAIDNYANAIVFGLIVGLILGLLENPLVEFMFGAFAAGFYDWIYGGNILLIVILGVIMAFISNVYLKDTILGITDNFKGML